MILISKVFDLLMFTDFYALQDFKILKPSKSSHFLLIFFIYIFYLYFLLFQFLFRHILSDCNGLFHKFHDISQTLHLSLNPLFLPIPPVFPSLPVSFSRFSILFFYILFESYPSQTSFLLFFVSGVFSAPETLLPFSEK